MTKITGIMAAMLITVAVIFDGVQFVAEWLNVIPILGTIAAQVITKGIDIVAILGFYIWLKSLNVSFADPKRAIRFFGAFLGELIPILDALPFWTIGIFFTVASVWAEEWAQKSLGLKLTINAHLAVGNPNPVAQPKEFAGNPKGFANNLNKLDANSGSFREMLNISKKSPRERNAENRKALIEENATRAKIT